MENDMLFDDIFVFCPSLRRDEFDLHNAIVKMVKAHEMNGGKSEFMDWQTAIQYLLSLDTVAG